MMAKSRFQTAVRQPARELSPAREAGFSLIEVMIALVVLGIGMLGVAAAQLRALQFAAESDNRTQAMYLAEEQLEYFLAMEPDNAALTPNGGAGGDPNGIILADLVTDTRNDEGVGEQTEYRRTWQIEQNTPQANLRRITVRVRWNPKGVPANSELNMVQLVGITSNRE
jgi:type IV pilus assembly protein PilV